MFLLLKWIPALPDHPAARRAKSAEQNVKVSGLISSQK